jgi:hypothetical protein
MMNMEEEREMKTFDPAQWLASMRNVRVIDVTYYNELKALSKKPEVVTGKPEAKWVVRRGQNGVLEVQEVNGAQHNYSTAAQRWFRGHKTKRTKPIEKW